MLSRRGATFCLVALATLLTLSHIIGPHGEFHQLPAADHTHSDHDTDSGSPPHDDADAACGQALPLETRDTPPVVWWSESLPAGNAPLTVAAGHVDATARPPPDPVSVLQVNRV